MEKLLELESHEMAVQLMCSSDQPRIQFHDKHHLQMTPIKNKSCKLALRVKRTLRPCSPKIYISSIYYWNPLFNFSSLNKFHWITIKIFVDYFQIDSLCMINFHSFVITSTKNCFIQSRLNNILLSFDFSFLLHNFILFCLYYCSQIYIQFFNFFFP